MPETFGARLRKARKSKKLKQYQLADKIGIRNEMLSRYERDLNVPTITVLEWICNALGMSATELLGF